MDFDERSLIPSSAGLAAAVGEDVGLEGRLDRRSHQNALRMDRRRALALPEPQPSDAVPPRMCRSCGYQHPRPGLSCVAVLRDRLSRFE